MQIEGDTSMITSLLLFYGAFSFFDFVCPLSWTGTMGKGAIIQAGKSPMCLPVQISGNQKNKLNDPGGGSFRYRRLCVKHVSFPNATTWGQHFIKQLSPWLQATLSAKAMSVYPSCLPGHLAACLAGWMIGGPFSLRAHHIATHCQPIDHPRTRPLYVSVTSHWQDCKWAKS